MRKAFFGIVLMLLLLGFWLSAVSIGSAKASGTIYIRTDGSVDPLAAPISTIDNVTYTLCPKWPRSSAKNGR